VGGELDHLAGLRQVLDQRAARSAAARRATEATAAYDSANDELVVDYRLGSHVPEPAVIPDIYVFGPDGFQRR